LHPNITVRDKAKVTESHPSENCSLIDEHENLQVPHIKNGEEDSNLSSESKNSDKENSNIRNNLSLPTRKASEPEPISSVTPALKKNAQSKLGLSEQQIKNIRQAPKFKGMGSVL
jgi:hypothetical protein